MGGERPVTHSNEDLAAIFELICNLGTFINIKVLYENKESVNEYHNPDSGIFLQF